VRAEVAGQVSLEIGSELRFDMADAEICARQDGKAAAPAGIVDVAAYGSRQDSVWLRLVWLRFHFGPLVGVRLGVYPRCFCEECGSRFE
jgi:uncharacterized membrane protein